MATNIKVLGVTPASGNRMVAPIDMSQVTPVAICQATLHPQSLSITLKGLGNAIVDWGDGVEPQHIALSVDGVLVTHYFEGQQASYTVVVFGPKDGLGESGLTYFTASGAIGDYYHTSSTVQNTPHHGIIS